MPHFLIHCSENILKLKKEKEIIQTVYDAALSTGLFNNSIAKSRLLPFSEFICGDPNTDFIHVFAHIMQGRTVEQKKYLSKAVVSALSCIFPNVPVISMNIEDFEKETYYNKSMLDE